MQFKLQKLEKYDIIGKSCEKHGYILKQNWRKKKCGQEKELPRSRQES